MVELRVAKPVDSLVARRAALRAVLISAVVRRRRWRRSVQAVVVAAAILGACWWRGQRSIPAAPLPAPGSTVLASDPYVVQVEHDDRDIVTRLRVAVDAAADRLDDDGLAAALSGCGAAAGIVRVGGRLLLPPDVAVEVP